MIGPLTVEAVQAYCAAVDEKLPENFYEASVVLMFALHQRWQKERRSGETFSMFVCGILAGIDVGLTVPAKVSS